MFNQWTYLPYRLLLNYAIVCTLFIFGSCSTDKIVDPPSGDTSGKQNEIEWPSLAKSPWPMVGGNPQFSGRSILKGLKNTSAIQWSLPVPGVNSTQSITSPVMGEDSTIYFVSSYEFISIDGINGQASFLYAVSDDGKLKWKRRLGKDSLDFGSNFCITSPVVLNDGSIVLATPIGYVMSFLPNGNLNWVFDEGKFKSFVSGTITVGKNGDMYIVDSSGELYSLTKSGTLNWKVKFDNGFNWGALSAISISPDGNTLYVGGVNTSKSIYAISTEGIQKWYFDAKYMIGNNILVDSNGNIYFGTNTNKKDSIYSAVYSLRNDGTIRWRHNKLSSRFGSHAIDANGNYFYTDGNNSLYSLALDGSLQWSWKSSSSLKSSILCDSEGKVYFFDSELRKISNNGAQEDIFYLNSLIWTSPLIDFGNAIVFTSIGNGSNFISKI